MAITKLLFATFGYKVKQEEGYKSNKKPNVALEISNLLLPFMFSSNIWSKLTLYVLLT